MKFHRAAQRLHGVEQFPAAFDGFARDALQSARVRVVQLPFDPSEIRYELSRIGNNLNQMTRAFHLGQIPPPSELGALLHAIRDIIQKAASDGS